MALNIITATFCNNKKSAWTDEQWQWNSGQILQFDGIDLPEAYEVHFSNVAIEGKSITQIGGENGVTIPDQFFNSGKPIYAWVYLHEGLDDGETVYSVTIPIKKRPQPSDTPPTPQEQSAIDQAIAALNVAVEKSETAITHYPHIQDGTWWIWDVTTKRWVDTGVEAQGEPGQPGQPGQPGEPGTDGVSPTITITDITGGHRVTVTDAEGTQTFDIMDGEEGAPGAPGQPGATGNGIASITKTGTAGLVDTYTITYTNGQTTTFTVTNGSDATVTVDTALSPTSENPVQNKVIDAKLGDLKAEINILDIVDVPSRNLNKTPYTDYTTKGLTFTVNEDNSVSTSGTPTANIWWPNTNDVANRWLLPAGSYVLSGGLNAVMLANLRLFETQSTTTLFAEYSCGYNNAVPILFTTEQDLWASCRFYVKNGTDTDGKTFKPQIEVGSIATEYASPWVSTKDSERIRSIEDSLEDSTSRFDVIEHYVGLDNAFIGYYGTINSVTPMDYTEQYPVIYQADEISFTKTGTGKYSGMQLFLTKFAIGYKIAVTAKRDIGSGWLIRIDFKDKNNQRIDGEQTTTGNIQERVIPEGTVRIEITLASNWNTTLEEDTVVTFSDIKVYYADIEPENSGNTTYTGEKVSLVESEAQHLCNVNLWQTYDSTNIPSGMSTNKVFYLNQSMTIFGNYMFFFSENGGGAVADYTTKEMLAEFDSTPTTNQHQNSAQFSDIYYDANDEFPLLFVSRCGNASYQSGEHDYDEMLVYRVQRSNTDFTFTQINSVKLNAQTYGTSWGVDNIRHQLYVCAPRNGNWQVPTGNVLDFWVFDEPSAADIVSGTSITLNHTDALAYFRHDYATIQGCAVKSGKLYLGISSGMQYIWVIDVMNGTVLSKVPIVNSIEIEGIAIYDGKLYTSNKIASNLYIYEVAF